LLNIDAGARKTQEWKVQHRIAGWKTWHQIAVFSRLVDWYYIWCRFMCTQCLFASCKCKAFISIC